MGVRVVLMAGGIYFFSALVARDHKSVILQRFSSLSFSRMDIDRLDKGLVSAVTQHNGVLPQRP